MFTEPANTMNKITSRYHRLMRKINVGQTAMVNLCNLPKTVFH